MAHILTLFDFYQKYWLREAKLLMGIFQVHAIILVFNLFYPSLRFLIAPFILTFISQIFYADRKLENEFYKIWCIPLIDRHYIKIVMLSVIVLSFLLHIQMKNGVDMTYANTILPISYFVLFFGLFFFIESKIIGILIIILLAFISALLCEKIQYMSGHLLIHGILLIMNAVIYRLQLNKLK
jgi:hypothetical protein